MIRCASATAPMIRMTNGLLCAVAATAGISAWVLLIAMGVSIRQRVHTGRCVNVPFFGAARLSP
ncbi:hypothetical protein FQZ97_1222430 [compost metagenome]